jgi:hypothetical protein
VSNWCQSRKDMHSNPPARGGWDRPVAECGVRSLASSFVPDGRNPSPGLSDDLSEIVSSAQGDVTRTEVSQRTVRSKMSANV